jgi:hypothetical protein
MIEEDESELSNISFFEFSFQKRFDEKKEPYNISRDELTMLFENLFNYRKTIEYKPKTQSWLWCISHYQEKMIWGKEYFFATLNRMRPTKIEKIFDLKEFEEKETKIENVIEDQWKFVIIPDRRLIAIEYSESLSPDLFEKIFSEIWIKVNEKDSIIKMEEKKETWTYDKVLREFEKIQELAFKDVAYPNPIIDNSIEEAKEWLKKLRIDVLNELKMKGKEEGINAEDILLASLARIVEKKKGTYEGFGLINGKTRSFHSGEYKITAKIQYKQGDIEDFIKKIIEKIENLFFR